MTNYIIIVCAIAVIIALVAMVGYFWRHYQRVVTVWDFQTGLHYKHGQFVTALTSGKHRLWGAGHDVILLENRVTEMIVQSQELITADSATLKLSALAQYRIQDGRQFHEGAADAHQALYTQVQLALRGVIGRLELDAIMARKAAFAEELLSKVQASPAIQGLGIHVLRVDIRDLMLGGELKAAFASVITARKNAQAQQEKARGDAAALRTMANAARLLENNPELVHLRYLDTLKDVGTNGLGNTFVVGLPDKVALAVSKDR